MEAVNGVSDGDKGAPPPPSPLTGCYLLIVVGEPHCNDHRDIILQRVAKGLLSWDVNDCLVDLEKELAIITEQGLEGEEARYGERLIQFASENLVTEILIHPVVSTLAQCVRNLLSSFTRHRHIIHAGYTFANNGSWVLQDGTFSLADFSEAFQEIEVLRVIRAYENGISLDIHCAPEGDWNCLPKEAFTKSCKVRVNPNDVLTAGSPSIRTFINYLEPFLVPAEIENILESSEVVGNIRFSRPTLYVFPGGQGDAALFGINGFNMLLDGGFSRKACFWDFVRHLDRLDAILLTRLNNSNVNGISSVLRRKKQNALYPQIGHFFCNIQERKAILSPDGDKDKDPLLINLLDEGQEIVSNLRHLSLIPQVCYRDSEPINLYHKVGHGTLDMYVLSPAKDSKEVREFLHKWNNNDQKLFANPKNNKDFVFPLQNLVSICALLVWQPANPEDTITRILFPGSSPQNRIFEGLDRIRSLDCIKHPVCSEKSLAPATIIKTKHSILDKIISTEKKFPIDNKREKPTKLPTDNILDSEVKNGDMNGVQPEKVAAVKKSDSTESEKSVSKPKKIIENGDKTEKPKPKPKTDPKPKARSDSQQRKMKGVDKKPSPTTPKKHVEKINGELKPKPSPTATPAKSTKEANNRKVVESKIRAAPKKEPPKPPVEKKEVKSERKPISRRPKDVSKVSGSPAKKVNGVQKPDTISKRGKLDKEGTTDSSTVSTPSADQDSILKKDISKLTTDEIQNMKAQELADLKEEQEAIKEIEAVFRKGELQTDKPSDFRKIKDLSIDDKLESEEYLIIEKTEIVADAANEPNKEEETQKIARDSEESEKLRKLSDALPTESVEVKEKMEIQDEVQKIIVSAADIVKAKDEAVEASKEISATSPEDKVDVSTDKKDIDNDIKENAQESQPDEKGSANVESGATTTAPTLPEDERMPLDEIKEDNGDLEEKHVKEDTKEKDVPVIQLPPKTFENVAKLPPVVGIRLDKQSHIRDIVKTPDEVADLPVHEEVDIDHYQEYTSPTETKPGVEEAKKDEKEIDTKEALVEEKQQLESEAKVVVEKKIEEVDTEKDKLPEEIEKEADKTVPKEKTDVDDKKEETKDLSKEKVSDAGKEQVETVISEDLDKHELSKMPETALKAEEKEDIKTPSQIEAITQDKDGEKVDVHDVDKNEKDVKLSSQVSEKIAEDTNKLVTKSVEEIVVPVNEKDVKLDDKEIKDGLTKQSDMEDNIQKIDIKKVEGTKPEEKSEEIPELNEEVVEKSETEVKEKDNLPVKEIKEEQKLTEELQKLPDVPKEEITIAIKAEEAKIEDVEVEEAKVGEGKVKEVEVGEAKVKEGKIEEVKVEEAIVGEGKVKEAEVEEAKVQEAKIEAAKVEEVKIEGAKVGEIKTIEVKVDDTEVERAKVEKIKVHEAKIEATKVEEVKIEEAKVGEIKTREVEVDETEVEGAKVEKVKVHETKDEKDKDETVKIQETKVEEATDDKTKVEEAKVEEPKTEKDKVQETKVKEAKVDDTKDEKVKIQESEVEEAVVDKARVEEAKAEEIKAEKTKVEEPKTEKTKVHETEVEETKVDETKDEKDKNEKAQIQESKVEAAIVDKAKVEEAKVEEVKVEEAKVEEAKAKEARVEEADAEETKTEKAKVQEIVVEEIKAEEVKVEETKAEKDTVEEIKETKTEEDTVEEINETISEQIDDKVQLAKEDVYTIHKIDEKLQELKDQEEEKHIKAISEVISHTTEQPQHAESVIITTDSLPESPLVDDKKFEEKIELGRKSPKEREEDVAKIVASVAEVLKSDAPLEEFEGKLPFQIPYQTFTTELRETHITTVESPVTDENKTIKSTEDVSPKASTTKLIEEERKIAPIHEEPEIAESKRSRMLKESSELMQATSKMINDIKQAQPTTESATNEELDADIPTVHRMLVTASSEDGGEETEICPVGTIIFSRSSESSGRSSPELQSQKVSQKSSIADTVSDVTVITKPAASDETANVIDDDTKKSVKEEVKDDKYSESVIDKTVCDKIETKDSSINNEILDNVDNEKQIKTDEEELKTKKADAAEDTEPKIESPVMLTHEDIKEITTADNNKEAQKEAAPEKVDDKQHSSVEKTEDHIVKDVAPKVEEAAKKDVTIDVSKATETVSQSEEKEAKQVTDNESSTTAAIGKEKDDKQEEHKVLLGDKHTETIGKVISAEEKKDLKDETTESIESQEKEDKSVVDKHEVKSEIEVKHQQINDVEDKTTKTEENVEEKEQKAIEENIVKKLETLEGTVEDKSGEKLDEVSHVEETLPGATESFKESLRKDVEETIKHANETIHGLEERVYQKVEDAKEEVKEKTAFLGEIVNDIGATLVKDTSNIVDETKKGIEDIKDDSKSVIENLKEDVKKKEAALVHAVEDLKQSIQTAAEKSTDVSVVEEAIDDQKEQLLNTAEKFEEAVVKEKEKVQAGLKEAKNIVESKVDEIKKALVDQKETVVGVAADVKEAIAKDVEDKFEEIKKEVIDVKEKVQSKVEDVTKEIEDKISEKLVDAKQDVQSTTEGAKQDLDESKHILEEVKGSIVEQTTAEVKQLGEKIQSAIQDLKDEEEKIKKSITEETQNSEAVFKDNKDEVIDKVDGLKKDLGKMEDDLKDAIKNGASEIPFVKKDSTLTDSEKTGKDKGAEEHKYELFNGLESVEKMVVDVLTADKVDSDQKSDAEIKTHDHNNLSDIVEKIETEVEEIVEKGVAEVKELVEETKEVLSSLFRSDSPQEKLLEKSAHDIEENYETLSELSKSIIFEKFDKTTEEERKKQEQTLEKTAKTIEEEYVAVEDIAKTVAFEKYEPLTDEQKRERVLEKTAKDIEEAEKIVEDMAKSIVFEKCDKPIIEEKEIETILEKSAKDIEETEKAVEEMAKSIEFEKCEKPLTEEKRIERILEQTARDIEENEKTVEDMAKSILFEKCEKPLSDEQKQEIVLETAAHGIEENDKAVSDVTKSKDGEEIDEKQALAESQKEKEAKLENKTEVLAKEPIQDAHHLKSVEHVEIRGDKESKFSGKSSPALSTDSKDLLKEGSGKSTPDIKDVDHLKTDNQDSLLSGKSSPGLSGKSSPVLSGRLSPNGKTESKDSLLSGKSSPEPTKPESKISSGNLSPTPSVEEKDKSLKSTPFASGKSSPVLQEEVAQPQQSTPGSRKASDAVTLDKELAVCQKEVEVKEEDRAKSDSKETPSKEKDEVVAKESLKIEISHEKKVSVSDVELSIKEAISEDKQIDDKPDNKDLDSIDSGIGTDVDAKMKKFDDVEKTATSLEPETLKTESKAEKTVEQPPKPPVADKPHQKSPEPEIPKKDSIPGPSSTAGTSLSPSKTPTDDLHLSGKSTPDIAEVERMKLQDATQAKHIPGSSTPPTVPVKEISTTQAEETKAPSPIPPKTSTITALKDSDIRSCTPGSDDLEIGASTYSDISSGQVSRAPHLLESERIESDDEDDVPGSPLSVTSQVAHSRSSSRYDFDDERLGTKMDPMNTSFYGALPDETEPELNFEKAMVEHRQTRGEDLDSSSYLYEITQAKFSSGTPEPDTFPEQTQLDQINKNEASNLMTASFMGDLPSATTMTTSTTETKKDAFDSWGKPLGLPSPAPPNDNRGTPKKERKLPSNVSAKNKLNDDKKRSESPSKYKNKKLIPVYVDLTYVPHHGNAYYSYVDFFKRVRARYYVFSGIEPSREVYNALLEAKQTWEDKELEVTIIPTYDTDILGYWVAENEELLTKYKIDLSPSASRCTINLQDHETSCSAYRLEF